MKITFDAAKLMNAVEWTTKVSKDSYILLDLTENTAVFRAEGDAGMRSMEVACSYDDPPENKQNYALSSPHLLKMNDALSKKKADGNVFFTLEDDSIQIDVSYENLRFPVTLLSSLGRLPSDSEVFSPIGTAQYEDFIECMKTAEHGIGAISGAISMMDITFDKDDNTVKMVGTDKFTLIRASVPFIKHDDYNPEKSSRFLIVSESGALRTDSETVFVEESGESMKLSFDNGQVATVRKQATKMTAWNRLVKLATDKKLRKKESSVIVDTAQLLLSSRISMLLSSKDSMAGGKVVCLKTEDGYLSISSNSDSSPSDKIPMTLEGDDISTKIPFEELLKALSGISAERVRIRYAGDSVPILLESILPDGTTDESIFVMTTSSR